MLNLHMDKNSVSQEPLILLNPQWSHIILGIIVSWCWDEVTTSLISPCTGSAGIWTEVFCPLGDGLLPWPLLLQITARKFMVYVFGLDSVPRRNKLLPLSSSAFPWFPLTSRLQFSLLPAYSPLAWGPFLSPCCGLNHLTSLSLMLVSNLLPSPCWSGSLCSASSFSPSQENKEESHATDILVAQTQPRLKPCKGKSGHMFIRLHILSVHQSSRPKRGLVLLLFS